MKLLGRLLIILGIAIPVFVMVWDYRQQIDDAIHVDRPAAQVDVDASQKRNINAARVGVTVGSIGAVVWVTGTVRQWRRRKRKSGGD
jgi:hypothetical protein